MADPNARVTRGGQVLTARVWSLIADAGREAGVSPVVVQGGYKGGGGANASAGTHDAGDVFDLRVRDLPNSQRVALAVALRRRNVCAWVRSPEYGWTKTAPHLHGVVRDSHDALSPGARAQVAQYDRGLNGLASRGPDPHPRPSQAPYVMPQPAPPPAPKPPPPPPPPVEDDMDLTKCDLYRNPASGLVVALTGDGRLLRLDPALYSAVGGSKNRQVEVPAASAFWALPSAG
jgi:hypothetical protein